MSPSRPLPPSSPIVPQGQVPSPRETPLPPALSLGRTSRLGVLGALGTLAACLQAAAPQAQAGFFSIFRSSPKPPPEAVPPKAQPVRSQERGNPPGGSQPAQRNSNPKTPPLTPEQRDALVRLQVFLDRALFSPARIDGRGGELTRRALNAYRRSQNLEPLAQEKEHLVDPDSPLYGEYTIREEDLRWVGNVPPTQSLQSRQRALPYTSLAEFVSERFHCTEELLAQLNPDLKLATLKAGDHLRVPDVEPFCLEQVIPTAALPDDETLRARSIRISLKDRLLELSEEGRLLAAFPIAVGSPALPTPKGNWRIYGISLMPVFRWDQGVLQRGVRTNQFFMLPPGPNNPVGVAWCALNRPGIGIHGTNAPESIGGAVSHGCMRVANWDVIRLTKLISPGISVVIE
jgi:lipoprotein-anchoring transpeptidase ErfK/SrfK